jgi:hypothetical protein
MDVVTAFLANLLDEEVYMEQPEGFTDGTDKVFKLERSIYGLKQSPKLWNKRLDERLKEIGFDQTHSDHGVYINKSTGVIVAIGMDDLVIFGKDSVGVDLLKRQLKEAFDTKDMGKLQYFLAIQVRRDRKNRHLQTRLHKHSNSQTIQLGELISSLYAARPWRPAQSSANRPTNLRLQTKNSINRMLYDMLYTRPDLAYTICKFRNSPQIHRQFTKRRQKDIFDISRVNGTTTQFRNYIRRKQGIGLGGIL